jgi:hypothetical protein
MSLSALAVLRNISHELAQVTALELGLGTGSGSALRAVIILSFLHFSYFGDINTFGNFSPISSSNRLPFRLLRKQ